MQIWIIKQLSIATPIPEKLRLEGNATILYNSTEKQTATIQSRTLHRQLKLQMEKLERKNFRSRYWPRIWKSFSNYSEESSIHSMSYIGKRNIHWIERFFWVLAFLFSLLSCSFLIYKTYEKWDNDPVLVTFNERSTPTWKIPFPAITICPESKTNVDKFNLTEKIEMHRNNETLSDDDETVLEALSQICKFGGYQPKDSKKTNGNYMKKLREVQTDFMNTSAFKIMDHQSDILNYFNEIFTDEGFCYTFNMLEQKDLFKTSINKYLRFPKSSTRSTWNVFGYDNADPFAYPLRILGSGVPTGIVIGLAMRKKDAVYSCKNTNGFRITFHTPDELPKPREHFYRIPFDVETLINVLPRKMSTSNNLKRYLPKKRQCYFRGEKRLQFFKHYNLANCRLECFTNFTLKRCGCVKFSMPNSYGTKVCNINKCIQEQETEWAVLELMRSVVGNSKEDTRFDESTKETEESILEFFEESQPFLDNSTNSLKTLEDELCDYEHDEYDEKKDEGRSAFESCRCLPACSSIHYDAEISQTKVNMEKHLEATGYSESDDEMLYSIVTVYFKDDQFIESKRSEQYGWVNFLSSCGGFLGLLMGGSLLSLIEIFYHLTIKRVFERTHNKARSEDEETGKSP